MSWSKQEIISRYIQSINKENTLLDLMAFDVRNRAVSIITNSDLLVMEVEDGELDPEAIIDTLKSISASMRDVLNVVDATLEIQQKQG